MHDNLIIHSNNVANLKDFKYKIKFSLSSSSIDEYISSDIINQIKNTDPKVIYIKDSLSANYLELCGLILAYHIRLSSELGSKRFVPIVILSDLNGYLLNKLTHMANILFTKNIFIAPNSKDSIDYYDSLSLQNMSKEEYQESFLNIIDVEPPKDYLSHHSITNEWSIYRWANFLNIHDSQVINDNNNKISSMLYFKYIVAKFPIPNKKGIKFVPSPPKAEGDLLYIDDQWDRGWQDIFNNYFNKTDINFSTLEEVYKDKPKDELIESLNLRIEAINPDLILLDLRLHDDDHSSDMKEEDFSGIKILKYVKEKINPGIQIIILTASGNSLILKEANKYNIVGYVKKEHPGDKTVNAKDNFKQLHELIETGLNKKYLKKIWMIQNDILKLNIFTTSQDDQIKILIESIFEILNSTMKSKFVYAMFSIFKVLEILINFYIEEKRSHGKRYAYWLNSGQIINHIPFNSNYPKETVNNDKNDSTENKIRIILHEKLGLADKSLHEEIHNIVKIRNNIIHPNKNTQNTTINEDHILKWFKILRIILSNIDKRNN